MKKCLNCNFGLDVAAKFCPECGTKQAIHCPSCDASVPQDAKFCAECGTKIGISTATSVLTLHELERIDIHDPATDLEECEIKIISVETDGPDTENRYNIKINYEITNSSQIDWKYLHTTLQIFSESGIIIDQLTDKSEELFESGRNYSKSEVFWGISGILFDGSIEKLHTVIAVTASKLEQKVIACSNLLAITAKPEPLKNLEIKDKAKIISGHLVRNILDDDDENDQIELKLSIQNISSKFLPVVWARINLSDCNDEQPSWEQDSIEIMPGDIRIINPRAYIKKSDWASTKLECMFTVLEPAAFGLKQVKGCMINAIEHDASSNHECESEETEDSIGELDIIRYLRASQDDKFHTGIALIEEKNQQGNVDIYGAYFGYIGSGDYDGGFFHINQRGNVHELLSYDDIETNVRKNLYNKLLSVAGGFSDDDEPSECSASASKLIEGAEIVDGDKVFMDDDFDGNLLERVSESWEIYTKFHDSKKDLDKDVGVSSDLPDPVQAAFKKLEGVIDAMGDAAARAKFYIKPNIPDKKLNGAIASYAQELEPKDIMMLYDSTVFGGGGEGVLFTGTKLFGKDLGSPGKSIKISQITNITYKHSLLKPQLIVNDQHFAQINNADKDAMIEFTGYVQQWADILKFGR